MHIITFIKILHLLGLVMGFGGAILLDMTIFSRGIIRPVSNFTLHQTEVLSRIVTWGLVILWISGIALIWMNTLDKPDYITNQKLWAKMAIVLLLSANGILIHHKILPYLKVNVGQRLFDGMRRSLLAAFTFSGSVSLVSWTIPFILGKASELNYVTPMWVILAAYAVAVLAIWATMFSAMNSLKWIQNAAQKAAAATIQPSDPWENNEMRERNFNNRPPMPAAPRRAYMNAA